MVDFEWDISKLNPRSKSMVIIDTHPPPSFAVLRSQLAYDGKIRTIYEIDETTCYQKR